MSEEKQPTIWCLHEDCTEERNPLNSKEELVSHMETHHSESDSDSEIVIISEPILESETTSKKKRRRTTRRKNRNKTND